MNVITERNFPQLYPKVEEALKNATFIAIDAEFSGLRFTDEDEAFSNESLFDSPKERYDKLRKNIEPFIAIQIGLSAFTPVKHANKYAVESFDFCLLPRALPTKNRTFLTQAAAVQFLTSYGFDFNRFARDGLSYLDEKDEAELSKCLREDPCAWDAPDFFSYEAREQAEDCFKRVEEWLRDKDRKEKVLRVEVSSYPVSYLVQKELRRSNKLVWTESSETPAFSVIKVTQDVRNILEERNSESGIDQRLLDYYKGFTKVFELMTSLKKPIVGHNLLLDLMFMHKQFFRPLPAKYETFKSDISRLFPLVYDTKFLSFEMKNVLNKVSWKSNILADLYGYYKDGPGRYLVFNSPSIDAPGASTGSEKEGGEQFHNAAWDSYCTGYCFIRMAHIYAVKKLSKDADLRELTNTEIMSAVQEKVNRINLIRADLSHIRLDGPDPISTRPRWLYVRPSTDNYTTRQIAQTLSRFGPVDVKRFSGNGVLVAVPNHGAAREILKFYKENEQFRIVAYNPLRHSFGTTKAFVWVGSLLVSGAGICAWILRRGGSSSGDIITVD